MGSIIIKSGASKKPMRDRKEKKAVFSLQEKNFFERTYEGKMTKNVFIKKCRWSGIR